MPQRKEATAKTKTVIWAKAAGRCQYPGCNEPLWEDLLSGKEDGNYGFIAHIVAAKPTGPRGDAILSPKLANEVSNLMLLCYQHHHLVDVEELEIHPVNRLLEMKKKHEERVIHQSSLQENRATSVLLFGANIGSQIAPVSFESAKDAILPEKYPDQGPPIELGMANTAFEDHDPQYWDFQKSNLIKLFNQTAIPRIAASDAESVSVFGLAPQPLLMLLGQLLSDIPNAEVFQRHREPPNWNWQDGDEEFELGISSDIRDQNSVALKLGISATINDDRVFQVLGNDVSIWSLSVPKPHNDCLKTKNQLSEFRQTVRQLFNSIKAVHEERITINVFPAIPVACAVEFGRVWMPKADLPLVIFDQNRKRNGFFKTLEIKSTSEATNE